MSREKSFVKSTAILAIGTFLPRLASFVILPIITGYLTKKEYGQYDLITVLVSLLLPVITLQIQTAAFRFLIDKRDNEEEKKNIISNIFFFSLPVSIIALVVTYFVIRMNPFTKLLICIYLLFDILVNTARQVTRGLGKNHYYSISSVMNSVVLMIGVVIFVYYRRMGLNGVIIAMIFASGMSTLYLFFTAKLFRFITPKAVNKKCLRQLLSYSWPMVPNSMSMWVMRLSDRVIVTSIMGPEANAVYAVANKIPHLLTLAQNTFSMAWQENASITVNDKDAPKYYSDMYLRIYRFIAGSMSLLIAAAPLLFKLLIKGDYGESVPQIPILIMAMFFSSLSAYLGGIYVALMKTKSVGVTTFVSAVINFAVNISLIWFIGIYAASISTLVSYIFLTIFRMIDVRKHIKLTYKWFEMLVILAILTAQCILYTIGTMPLYIVNCVTGVILFIALNIEILKGFFTMLRKKLK